MGIPEEKRPQMSRLRSTLIIVWCLSQGTVLFALAAWNAIESADSLAERFSMPDLRDLLLSTGAANVFLYLLLLALVAAITGGKARRDSGRIVLYLSVLPALAAISGGTGLVIHFAYTDHRDNEVAPVIEGPLFPINCPIFKNGLYEGKKMGYVDKKGRMAIEPRFDWAEPFSEGLAIISST